jgi:hypothetical protein
MPDIKVQQFEQRIALGTAVNRFLSPIARVPTAVLWNRLEGRPRSNDLSRPMRAEVRDPLWMLARQWQFGEFEGEDAGLPIGARLETELQSVTTMTLRDRPMTVYDGSTPLETVVERHAVQPDLMMSLFIGRRWIKRLGEAIGTADPLIQLFRDKYRVSAPALPPAAPPPPRPPGSPGPDLRALHLDTHAGERDLRWAVSGRSLDGAVLMADINKALQSGTSPSDEFAGRGVAIPGAQRAAIDAAAEDVRAEWFAKLFPHGGPEQDAWVAEQLEHRFSLGASGTDDDRTTLIADQYAEGHLDWYSFDVSQAGSDEDGGDATDGEDEDDEDTVVAPPERRVISFLPTRVQFPGMPNVRWWEFEDRRVGFGLATAAKTDLVKLLLAEFGLVFSNDWFILPLKAAVGTLIDTRRTVVSDNFGFNTLVEPTAKRHGELGLAGRWTMWTLSARDAESRDDLRVFLAPAVGRSLQSAPIDEVLFLRDEMANLVWAVEVTIPDPLGGGRDARTAATLLRNAITSKYKEDPAPGAAEDVLLTYQLMGSVPENWIPLVSVRLAGQTTSTAFLQGAMPRVPPLDPKRDASSALVLESHAVLPRGTILSHDPVSQPNLINEEEILRGGVVVTRAFQQTRWHNGRTFTWASRQKKNGRGEGSSGLAFDQVILRRPDEAL